MTTVAGASQYLNSATLANRRGVAPASSTLLGDGGIGSVDLLDAGRRIQRDNGIGLSSRSRELNKQFLNSSKTGFNGLFSLGVATTVTIEAITMKINALRSTLPQSQIASHLRGKTIDEQA